MKKALALVLALVLALSMAVSSFALTLVDLTQVPEAAAKKTNITVVDAKDTVLYLYDVDAFTYRGTTFYVALEDEAWKDIKLTTNGNVTAELVKYDPASMNLVGMDVVFAVVDKEGNQVASWSADVDASAIKDINENGTIEDWEAYEAALANAKALNAGKEVTYYSVKVLTNVNVIKVVVEKNYTAHFTEGSIVVEAKLDKKDYKGEIVVINDVIICEYEEVKWTAENFEDEAALYAGAEDQLGYSDWFTDEHGYSKWVGKEKYDEMENRVEPYAAVVSTTAFRAIEGKDLLVYSADELSVALYDIVKGQKGVNFLGYVDYDFVDENKDLRFDPDKENITAIEFGYLGDQVIKGAFEINLELELDWYELRELFGLKVEEDDIISYYLVDENGKVVGGKEVDYMTADLTETVEFTIKGENSKLGEYKIVLEVPSAEVGEANPNTGAESVVGVVAALAVVSVATAAAVSLKK